MKKYYLHKQIGTLLLALFFIPCYGQVVGNNFRCGIRDKAGNLWFGTIGAGVFRYDAVSAEFTNFTKQDGLNDNNVESVFEDKAGNLWFGTEHGVSRFDGKSFTDISTKVGLGQFNINYFLEDRSGNIWIASDGWGVFRYNPVSGAIANFKKDDGFGSNLFNVF